MKNPLLDYTVIGLCFALILWLWAVPGHAEHIKPLEWMRGTTADDGSSCCGVSDCTKAHAKLLEEPVAGTVDVYIEAVTSTYYSDDWMPVNARMTLPVKSVHQAAGTTDIWCYRNWGSLPEVTAAKTRCLFIAVGN